MHFKEDCFGASVDETDASAEWTIIAVGKILDSTQNTLRHSHY